MSRPESPELVVTMTAPELKIVDGELAASVDARLECSDLTQPVRWAVQPKTVDLKPGYVGIEVKGTGGVRSDHQKHFQERLEAAGGRYILARSPDDVVQGLAIISSPP